MSEAKEFWIFKGTSNFCSELVPNDECTEDVKAKPEGFYDIVSLKDTVEGGTHVIEYSAYLTAKLRVEMYQQAAIDDTKVIKNLESKVESLNKVIRRVDEALMDDDFLEGK